jgi:hypothetical protein
METKDFIEISGKILSLSKKFDELVEFKKDAEAKFIRNCSGCEIREDHVIETFININTDKGFKHYCAKCYYAIAREEDVQGHIKYLRTELIPNIKEADEGVLISALEDCIKYMESGLTR